MRFQYPGHDLAFWTGFWILLGSFTLWMRIRDASTPWYMGVTFVVGVFALGIWFRLRPAGYIFLALCLLLGAFGIVTLPFAFSWKRVGIVITHLCAAHSAFEWLKKTADELD